MCRAVLVVIVVVVGASTTPRYEGRLSTKRSGQKSHLHNTIELTWQLECGWFLVGRSYPHPSKLEIAGNFSSLTAAVDLLAADRNSSRTQIRRSMPFFTSSFLSQPFHTTSCISHSTNIQKKGCRGQQTTMQSPRRAVALSTNASS